MSKIHSPNDGLKTALQWQKEKRTPIDEAQGVELWNNCWCRFLAMFYSEDQTREMTEAELFQFQENEKHKRKISRLLSRNEQVSDWCVDFYEDYLRSIYNTPYQWLNMGYRVVAGAKRLEGSRLNWCKASSPFGNDYFYVRFDQVELIDTIEDFVKEQVKSYQIYYKKDPPDEDIKFWQETDLQRVQADTERLKRLFSYHDVVQNFKTEFTDIYCEISNIQYKHKLENLQSFSDKLKKLAKDREELVKTIFKDDRS